MFPEDLTIEGLNAFCEGCMVSHVDIEFTEIGTDYLIAKMPVSDKTRQPMGLLHGGASVVLAETLGSVAAGIIVSAEGRQAVGLSINANHIRGARSGYVYGKATPTHIGRSTHLWEISITDDNGRLISVSKLTMAILDKK